ncbi:MAG: ATP-binding protein [Chloroflexi bacterium]|nr:ATP-binding protein [Chloroflexota bacterium]
MLVAIVPIILISLFSFRAGSQGIRRHTEAHLQSVVIVKAQEVERWFRPLEAIAYVLAGSEDVKSYVSTMLGSDSAAEADAARQNLLAYFDDVVRRQIGLQEIAIVSPDHSTLIVSNVASSRFDPSSIPSLVNADAPYSVYMPAYVPQNSMPKVSLIVPLEADGKVIACVMLRASALPLYETMSPDPGLGADGKVYLMDGNGAVLTPPQQASASPDVIVASGLMSTIGEKSSGLQYVDFLGTEVMGSYEPMEELGWGVVAELPVSQAFSDITEMRLVIAGASTLFFLLTVSASFLISRRVTKPLTILTAGAQAVGKGNLSHRITVSSSDAIGLLARTFNEMAEDLQSAQSRMVEAERAAALQAFTEEKVEQLKQLSRAGLRIALESSLERLAQRASQMAREITGADAAAVVVCEPGQAAIEHLGHTDAIRRELLDSLLQHTGVMDTILQGQVVDHDSRTHQGPDECAQGLCGARFSGIRAILAVPLHADGGEAIGGVIIASLASDAEISAEDHELIQIIAGYVSAAIQKLRKEHTLQSSEQKALAAVEELRRAQEQLVQAQKMESVGRLAGGVAHDFNNLLTPIMGYAQLGIMGLPPGNDRLRANLLEIQKAGERASNLTRQLLAFSRRQITEPKVLSLNNLIVDMDKMLRRLIGEDIELATLPDSALGMVEIDPGQMEQVLMNLVVNARDAMPIGGKITIETANVALDEEYARVNPGVSPGDYVALTVSDTGTGMTDEVKARIFEPFFTTKEDGKGTGLGLATCYGIAKQYGGHIAVYTELGHGTTFKVYLPRYKGEVKPSAPARNDPAQMPRGTETVLLVEDEDAVRKLAARVLEGQGYTVLEASNGEEALRLVEENPSQRIDLLLTDVVMPRMGGRELSERLREMTPELKVIYTSGYTDDAILRHGILTSEAIFTQKPFSPSALAVMVRNVLDDRPPS